MPSTTRLISAALLAVVLITAHTALVKVSSALKSIQYHITSNTNTNQQSEWNGTVNLENILANPTTVLPNTKIPIKLLSSGSKAVDNYFAFMTAFFSTSLDPRNVRAHVAGNHLLGSLSSIWLLMLAEAHNSSPGFLTATYAIEMLGEFLGIGIFTPIWAIVHLFSTPAPTTTGTHAKRPEANTKALGYALVLGHVVPTILMLQLKADGEGFASQQIWTIARLFHPVFTFVSWAVIKTVLGNKSSSQSAFFSRRKIYLFSILASGFFHVTSLGWFLADRLSSGWIKDDVLAALRFQDIVTPAPFWSAEVVGKVAWEDGVAIFLQWDYLCSAAAIFIWAAGIFVEARNLGPDATGSSRLEVFAQSLLVTVLAGPAAGGAYLLLERDAVLLARAAVNQKKVL